MKQISYDKTRLLGFWKERFDLNKAVTIPSVYNRFSDTGRFAALNCSWKEGDENKPHIFWDSDVAKWMEAVAYTIRLSPDEKLEKLMDDTIDVIAEHQLEDGYYNSYYITCELENRFTNRDHHELYCAGHFTEAAVAYYEATGKDKFLKVMCKYIDYIEKRFKIEDSASFCTPGHEEIELALIKLYRCTKEKRYLELCRHFIEKRGRCDKDLNCRNWCGVDYDQSEAPVRELTAAIGHSVRAMYLYCGMADLAEETGDKTLFDACERLFESAVNRRMYITGGIGSSAKGEQFADDWILPNDVAYSETCASIGLAFFARRMSAMCPDSKYDDAAETAIYNCALAGVSLDGRSFFYVNPLEINMDRHQVNRKYYDSKMDLLTQRLEVFGCSCCPPNIIRLIASIGDFLYTTDDNILYIHHYMQSESEFDGVKISQKTGYPNDGKVMISVSGMKGRTVAVRLPGWCDNPLIDGEKPACKVEKGYAYIDIPSDDYSFELDFEMKFRLVSANPNVEYDAGRVCICRGPLVYCAESVLNGGRKMNKLAIRDLKCISADWDETAHAFSADVTMLADRESDRLYMPYDPDACDPVRIHMLPYFAYANHGESDMLVWFRTR